MAWKSATTTHAICVTMIEVYCRAKGKRKWEKVPNGPFPISEADFVEARRCFLEEYNSAPEESQLMDCWATTARIHLQKVCPKMSSFDQISLGNPLAMYQVKVVEV